MLERAPGVGVAVIRGRGLRVLLRVRHVCLVGRQQHVQAAARVRGEGVVEPAEGVGVADLAVGGVDQVRDLVEVAAPRRDQPLPGAFRKSIERDQAGVEQAQPELVMLVGLRVDRSRLDDRAHAFAEVRRESAGVHVHAAQDARVEQARRAQQQLEMERLVQRKAIERHQRLVVGSAAHVRESRNAVARCGGQAVHRLQRIVGEPRQLPDLLLREDRVSVRDLGRQRVPAGGYHHFLEGNRILRHDPGRGCLRGRRLAHDCIRVGADWLRLETLLCKDFLQQLQRRPRCRLTRDAQRIRHDFAAVDEVQAPGAEFVEHCAQRLTSIGRTRRKRRQRGEHQCPRRQGAKHCMQGTGRRGLERRVRASAGAGTRARRENRRW